MGQATLELPGELPDPIELPPDPSNVTSLSAAALASADDLLSQLAGEDIDRLLAEAENAGNLPDFPTPPLDGLIGSIELPPEPATEPATKPVETPQASIATLSVPETTAGPTAPPAADTPAADTPAADTLGESKDAEALQAMIEPTPPAPAMVEAPPVIPIAIAAEAPLMIETTTAAEIAALLDPAADSDESDAEDSAAHSAAASRGPSVIVRVLQLVNTPMSWISDAVRDALGKVALLTLFNAVAVLVYVLVFRRHGR